MRGHNICLIETVLMRGHNIMFSLRNKKKISLNYPQYPLLSGALVILRRSSSATFNFASLLIGRQRLMERICSCESNSFPRSKFFPLRVDSYKGSVVQRSKQEVVEVVPIVEEAGKRGHVLIHFNDEHSKRQTTNFTSLKFQNIVSSKPYHIGNSKSRL